MYGFVYHKCFACACVLHQSLLLLIMIMVLRMSRSVSLSHDAASIIVSQSVSSSALHQSLCQYFEFTLRRSVSSEYSQLAQRYPIFFLNSHHCHLSTANQHSGIHFFLKVPPKISKDCQKSDMVVIMMILITFKGSICQKFDLYDGSRRRRSSLNSY